MSDKNMGRKPMTTNTIKEILIQDYKTVKALKKKPDLNYAEMYKKIIKNKNKIQNLNDLQE